MKKFFMIAVLAALTTLFFSIEPIDSKPVKVMILNTNTNLFNISEGFTSDLADRFIRTIGSVDNNKLTVYINSPGGSVMALHRMLSAAKAYPKVKITCINATAASAAFMFFELACTERLVLPYGYLMSHNASAGFFGELPRIRGRLELVEKMVEPLEREVAKKIGMKYEVYITKINREWWIQNSMAKGLRLADDVLVRVRCSEDLIDETEERTKTTFSLFGGSSTVVREYSKCPLISAPLPKVEEEE